MEPYSNPLTLLSSDGSVKKWRCVHGRLQLEYLNGSPPSISRCPSVSKIKIPFMSLKVKRICLNSLDFKDKTFLLSYGYDINPLKQSIAQVGLLNPPVVRKKSDATYQIVCGYKRTLALKKLGVSSIRCAILPSEKNDEECLLLNIYDNVSHREFNPIEKSLAINKLKNYYTEEEIAHNFLPLLKLQPHMTQLNVFKPLCRLEKEIQTAVLEGRISEHTATRLSQMDRESRRALGKLFVILRLSVSKQIEVLEYVSEIAVRENRSVENVITMQKISSVLKNDKLNQHQKGETVRKYLRELRYPQLTEKEKEFNHNIRKLKLSPGVSLKAPPFFEGDHYHINLHFNDRNGLKKRLQELESLLNERPLINIIEG